MILQIVLEIQGGTDKQTDRRTDGQTDGQTPFVGYKPSLTDWEFKKLLDDGKGFTVSFSGVDWISI